MTAITDQDVLAIDIGGTKIALAIVGDGEVRQRVQVPTPRSGKGDDIVSGIVEQAALLPQTSRAGVATTGIVDQGRLTALNPSTLPIENGYPIVEALEAQLSQPVIGINDAQAAAWAEYRCGAGQQARRLVFITVSTGVGGGLVLDGELQIGAHGLAGHIGHMVSDVHGPLCGCGRKGCIETLASGSAIGRFASAHYGRPIAAPEVFTLADQGDAEAETILQNAAGYLANMLCDLVAGLDLDLIVLGGGVGLADGFIDRLRTAISAQPEIFRRPVVHAAMGADAGLVGVAQLVSDGKFHI